LVAKGCILCYIASKYDFIKFKKGVYSMANAVKVSENLLNEARLYAKVQNRSVAKQIEYWAKIGKVAEDNPDLPLSFILDILKGQEEIEQGLVTPYVFGEDK
jgi:hypothetical protein